MGKFTWPIQISTVDGLHAKRIDAIVDTGAAYTTLPTPLLRDIGVEPVGQRRFLLADGRRIFHGVRRGPCNDRRRECDNSGRIRRRERSPASRGLYTRRTRPSRRPRRAAPRPYSRNPVLARPSSIPAPRSGCKRNVRLRRMRRGVNPSPSPSPPSFRLSAAGIHPAAWGRSP